MADMIRVNTRISKTLNDWMDKQSEETGISKSTQIMLALETYFQQKEAVKAMSDMGVLMGKLNEIEKRLPAES